MATQDLTGSGSVPGAGYDGLNRAYIAENTVSLVGESIAANDAVKCLEIEAGTWVTCVSVEVDTAVGSTCTATVGDGNGTASWDASTNLNATAGTITQTHGTADAYGAAGGVMYSTADTIDLSFQNAATSGEFTVRAICYKIT